MTCENFVGYPVSVSGVITVPVSASMYQTMVANISQIHTNSDGTMCVTPMVSVPKVCRIINVNSNDLSKIKQSDSDDEQTILS